jgi:hypothetical protein
MGTFTSLSFLLFVVVLTTSVGSVSTMDTKFAFTVVADVYAVVADHTIPAYMTRAEISFV